MVTFVLGTYCKRGNVACILLYHIPDQVELAHEPELELELYFDAPSESALRTSFGIRTQNYIGL